MLRPTQTLAVSATARANHSHDGTLRKLYHSKQKKSDDFTRTSPAAAIATGSCFSCKPFFISSSNIFTSNN